MELIQILKHKGFKMVKITLSNEVVKNISKEAYYSEEAFINDAKTYIKAVESGRILYEVLSVSSSGMSRQIMIKSYEGTMKKGYYRSYYGFLNALGYRFNKDRDGIIVCGCGMNMLFATNYNIIGRLKFMGFLNDSKAKTLQQKVN